MAPECIVLDEATAMLDPAGRREVLSAIRTLNKERGITVVLITHHMDEAMDADRLIVMNDGKLVIDGAPAEVFAEWALQFDPTATAVHSEYRFGQSRLDFCLETPQGLHLVEVKGVTLEDGGHTRFPDAPTERGVKHLHELMHAVELGHRATAFFVIQMADVVDFAPNDATHPAFGEALRQAKAAGVNIAAYSCRVTPDSMAIDQPVEVLL